MVMILVLSVGAGAEPTRKGTILTGFLPQKIELISCGPMAHISDIKLIRTDTTLDLSQKAEKDTQYDVESPVSSSSNRSFYILRTTSILVSDFEKQRCLGLNSFE
ncbi:hypothetical protein N665_0175s0017 [Sinapis alba]|nr:hypothetical protein N665_0175s0017 [Sinapis alba]